MIPKDVKEKAYISYPDGEIRINVIGIKELFKMVWWVIMRRLEKPSQKDLDEAMEDYVNTH